MPLNALLGQPRAANLLGGSLASGRVHHAYLLAGPAGVGKSLAAKLVAQALNCESPAAQAAAARGAFVDDPCGSCASCRKIDEDPKKHAHPLVMWVDTEAAMEAHGLYSPEGDRTAAKAIGVRLMRELVIPRLALAVLGGRRKVAILKDVDMTEGAQNAFLKTLEEPPGDTTFLMLSSAPDALKPTIRSRCLRVPFGPLAREVVAGRVMAAKKIERGEAELRAALADGNIGRALQLDPKALQARRDLLVQLERLAADDWAGWLALAEALGSKDDAVPALEVIESWLQDVLRVASGEDAPASNLDLAAEARAAAERLGPREALRRLAIVRRTKDGIEHNQQPRLALERAFLAFQGIEPLTLGEQ
jgi:DNA polymerase-3 subunit delta'